MAKTADARPYDAPSPVNLAILFGIAYFIQGIAEPTEGLIAQPVRSLLKTWGQSAGQITEFMAIMALPWTLKPIYGLVSDFVPLFGSHRRSWLIVSTFATTAGLGYLFFVPPSKDAIPLMLALLVIPTVGVAFTDVVIDALMVQHGQPLNLTGRLQSIQWASIYSASMIAGLLGGWLSQHKRQDLGFLICSLSAAVSLVLAVTWVRERPDAGTGDSLRVRLKALYLAGRDGHFLAAAGFLFLWNFNPFSTTIQYLYATQSLGLSEQFYGGMTSLFAVGAVLACITYGAYCRRLSPKTLIHLSIVSGVVMTLCFAGLRGPRTAIAIWLFYGFTYMTGSLVQLDLAARVCPPQVAGTVFALLMSLSNLGVVLGTVTGGKLYDLWKPRWGATLAFDALVIVGAAFTAACWLLLPWLTRGSAEDE